MFVEAFCSYMFDKDENEAFIAIYHGSKLYRKTEIISSMWQPEKKKQMFVPRPLIGSTSLSTPQQLTRVFK